MSIECHTFKRKKAFFAFYFSSFLSGTNVRGKGSLSSLLVVLDILPHLFRRPCVTISPCLPVDDLLQCRNEDAAASPYHKVGPLPLSENGRQAATVDVQLFFYSCELDVENLPAGRAYRMHQEETAKELLVGVWRGTPEECLPLLYLRGEQVQEVEAEDERVVAELEDLLLVERDEMAGGLRFP